MDNYSDIGNSASLFQQTWWLDAVAPGSWDEAKVLRDGRIVARMPYMTRRRLGLRILTMPKLTPHLGPWIEHSKAKYTNRLSEEYTLMESLIDQLPSFDLFRANFHHSITTWLPFYWRGFRQTTYYTYRLSDLANLDFIWGDFRHNIRTHIRKAEKQLTIRTDRGLSDFLRINELTFKRQGLRVPYTDDFVRRIDLACDGRQCRKMFFAEDSSGRVHAAIYIVWDRNSAYYLMGGADPDLRNSGATSLLLWEAIKFASKMTNSFDFEGSIIKPVERFFRDFGAFQTPYLAITGTSKRMRFLFGAQEIVKAAAGRTMDSPECP